MKIRPLVATVGAILVVILVASPVSASAPCYNYGTRNVPLGAVAGGARFAAVVSLQVVGESTGTSAEVCSTGVPWRLADGTRGFLTAGHCLPAFERAEAQIYRSAFNKSHWVPGAPLGTRLRDMTTSNASGTISHKVGDIAFVPSLFPVGNYVFTGGPGTKALTKITSWASRATSTYTLCFSGFRSGSHCGLKQGKKTSLHDSTTGANYTGLGEAYYGWGSPSQICGNPGDSGGVVYRMSPDGRSAYVVGILSGSSGKVTRFSGCSMYYTPLSAAVKQFGGGPIVS